MAQLACALNVLHKFYRTASWRVGLCILRDLGLLPGAPGAGIDGGKSNGKGRGAGRSSAGKHGLLVEEGERLPTGAADAWAEEDWQQEDWPLDSEAEGQEVAAEAEDRKQGSWRQLLAARSSREGEVDAGKGRIQRNPVPAKQRHGPMRVYRPAAARITVKVPNGCKYKYSVGVQRLAEGWRGEVGMGGERTGARLQRLSQHVVVPSKSVCLVCHASLLLACLLPASSHPTLPAVPMCLATPSLPNCAAHADRAFQPRV